MTTTQAWRRVWKVASERTLIVTWERVFSCAGCGKTPGVRRWVIPTRHYKTLQHFRSWCGEYSRIALKHFGHIEGFTALISEIKLSEGAKQNG